MRTAKRFTLAGKGAAGTALALGLALWPASVLFPTSATAEEVLTFAPFARGSTNEPPVIHSLTHTLARRWTASYGVGEADQTALTSSLMRFDQTLAYGTRSDGESRNDWRHFLGLEYSPIKAFALSGGIAKANGNKARGFSPTGYERIRLNVGARWIGDQWGLDGSFSFIPTGTERVPSDAAFVPGTGGTGPTFLFSLMLSRRF